LRLALNVRLTLALTRPGAAVRCSGISHLEFVR
jgi:hypothetical protein